MNDKNNRIKIFEDKQVRYEWDEQAEKWWFSVVDICAVLTDNDYQKSRNYWKWLKNKLSAEGSESVGNTNQYGETAYAATAESSGINNRR